MTCSLLTAAAELQEKMINISIGSLVLMNLRWSSHNQSRWVKSFWPCFDEDLVKHRLAVPQVIPMLIRRTVNCEPLKTTCLIPPISLISRVASELCFACPGKPVKISSTCAKRSKAPWAWDFASPNKSSTTKIKMILVVWKCHTFSTLPNLVWAG